LRVDDIYGQQHDRDGMEREMRPRDIRRKLSGGSSAIHTG
jgi:hypothetical protein